MTQENINLLLKDLCARLPYGVKVRAWRRHSEGDPTTIGYPLTLDFIMMSIMFKDNIEEYKPFLFPLSSMTKEQMEEFNGTLINEQMEWSIETFDWLNANHLDYRGLIPLGLAIDATELNIY